MPGKKLFWRSAALTLALSTSACAEENCTFNNERLSQKHYATNQSVATFHYFTQSNEVKGVLKNGNLFSIKQWSCDHYGKQAILILGPQLPSIPEILNDQLLALGELALEKLELELVTKAIHNTPLKLANAPLKLNIPTDEFNEFYVQIGYISDVIIIEIKLYKS